MDHFQIGRGLRRVTEDYFDSARRTGRTTALVESVREGDRIVCSTLDACEELRQLLRERDVGVAVVMVPPGDPQSLFHLGRSTGRTLFDHGWLEAFYREQLNRATHAVDLLQLDTSGPYSARPDDFRRPEREHSRRYWRGPGRRT